MYKKKDSKDTNNENYKDYGLSIFFENPDIVKNNDNLVYFDQNFNYKRLVQNFTQLKQNKDIFKQNKIETLRDVLVNREILNYLMQKLTRNYDVTEKINDKHINNMLENIIINEIYFKPKSYLYKDKRFLRIRNVKINKDITYENYKNYTDVKGAGDDTKTDSNPIKPKCIKNIRNITEKNILYNHH